MTIPDVFCQVTLTAITRAQSGHYHPICGEPAVSPYGLCRKHEADRQRLMTPSPASTSNLVKE